MITLKSQGIYPNECAQILNKIVANIGQESNEQIVKNLLSRSELLNALTIKKQLTNSTLYLARHLAIETPQEIIIRELDTYPHEIHDAIRYDKELQACWDIFEFALYDLSYIHNVSDYKDISFELMLKHIAVINEQFEEEEINLSDEDMLESAEWEREFKHSCRDYYKDTKVTNIPVFKRGINLELN